MNKPSEHPVKTAADVCDQLKALMVETLMLQLTAAEISDKQPLFGPGGMGLDSVDALQLVVMLDKNFGLKVSDAESARSIGASLTLFSRLLRSLPRSCSAAPPRTSNATSTLLSLAPPQVLSPIPFSQFGKLLLQLSC